MAIQRTSPARGTCVLLAVATATLAWQGGAVAADGTAPGYRVPRWVEHLAKDTPPPPRTETTGAPAAPLPQAATTANPIRSAPVEIAATPRPDGRERPGRALLRSRAPAAIDSQSRLASGWGEIGGKAIPASFTAEESDSDEERGLGPENSVLEIPEAPAPSAAVVPPARLETPPPDETSTVAGLLESAATGDDEAPRPDDDAPAPPPLPGRTPDGEPELAIEPVTFAGILVGRTDRAALRAAMEPDYGIGEPFTREDGTEGFAWSLTDGIVERVEATLSGETVDSLRLKLADPLSVDQLSTMFEIGDLNSVAVLDESGVSIGEVFPEVGLVFSLKPGTRSALAVMIEPLDPEAFVLRAEGELETDTSLALADLKFAVTLDPRHLRARRMLLVLLCEQGKWAQALDLARGTEELDPDDVWTRLKTASILASLGRFDESRDALEVVKRMPRLEGVGNAQVERMLGRLDLDCDRPDERSAVRHFEAAIRTANSLKNARSESIRDAARDVLLDTHLGMAVAIAKGEWQRKAEVVSKWLAAASKLVEAVDEDSDTRPLLEIQLCRGALAAAAACDSVDPLPWVKRLLVTRDRMAADLADPWRRRQVDWEVGHGLADALAATQARGEANDSLDNATLTVAYLERGAETRDLTDAERASIGDLLFRIGVLHSIQHGDHATAVTWFDKVRPYWSRNASFESHGEVGRIGESYVSMAVSYWQVDRRDDALDLCRRGIDYMVSAVDAKLLEEPALAIAYDNLAKMYAEQGEEERSRTYAEMAARAEAAGQRR